MIEGTLNLSHNGADYIIFDKGNSFNISELMNSMLLDKVNLHIEIGDDFVCSRQGKLIKQKQNKLWLYFCGSTNIDELLWENVGNRIKFGIQSIDYDDDEGEVAES